MLISIFEAYAENILHSPSTSFFGINGDKFQRQYKDKLSNYHQWEQQPHAEDWILFPNNIGSHLSIDEASLSQGELYTVVTNKAGKGRSGCLVAMIKGVRAENVVMIRHKIPHSKRRKVKEVTVDMAGAMNIIAQKSFPCAQ
ncbi:MAG: transposase, partial [Mangrovibacterium sp.]